MDILCFIKQKIPKKDVKKFFKLMQTFVLLKPFLFFVFYCSIMKLNKPFDALH